MKSQSFLIISLLFMNALVSARDVSYKISFKGNFSENNHPVVNFPGNPHFSPLTIASHNANYSMFQIGDKATTGVKIVAETGSNTRLIQELRDLRSSGIVKSITRTNSGTNGEGMLSAQVIVSDEFPMISVMTMIAPSPDWIIGLSDYSLKKNGRFIKRRMIPLYAFDAGTDKGKNFTSVNRPNHSQESIHLLTNVSGKLISKPFGFLLVERK